MEKGKNKIRNWKQYNQALVNRGSVTFWRNDAAIQVFHYLKHKGHRGRGFIFLDTAINKALMVKSIFKLTLSGLEGFLLFCFYVDEYPSEIPYIHLH